MIPLVREELLAVVQRFLDSKVVRGRDSPDHCTWAVEVDLLQDWIESPRIIAIVRSADNQQSALFLCVGSQISKGVYLDLSTLELIALDDVFRSERGPSTTVRITGRRLSKRRPLRPRPSRLYVIRSVNECGGSSQNSVDETTKITTAEATKTTTTTTSHESNGQLDCTDSDEPLEPVGVLYLHKDTRESPSSVPSTTKSTSGKKSCYRVYHFTLRFPNVADIARFNEETAKQIELNRYTKLPNMRTNPSVQIELGADLAQSTDLIRLSSWLDKYRPDVSRNRGGRSAIHRGIPTRPVQITRNRTRDENAQSDSLSSNGDSALSDFPTSSTSDSSDSAPEPQEPVHARLRHMTSVNDNTPESDPTANLLMPSASPLVQVGQTRAYSSTTSLTCESLESNLSSPEFQNLNDFDLRSEKQTITTTSTTTTVTATDGDLTSATGASLLRNHQKVIVSSQSCSDLTSHGVSLRRRSKNFLEDHLYRARLSQSEWLIRQELLKRSDEYCTFENVRIFVGTWNVNGRSDSHLSLDNWLLPPNDQPPADIYVFGFQELDLSIGAVALNKTSPAALEDRWTMQLETALGGLLRPPPSRQHHRRYPRIPEEARAYALKWAKHTGGGYIRLKRARLAGMLMIVYISTRMFTHANASELAIQLVPTGVFNVMGNKGAVGLRLTLYNTAICFVNCHLAAGEANLERRNQDFQEIKRKMVFERRAGSKNPSLVDHLTIQSHDIVFVFGDLNYRISGLDSAKVRDFIDLMDYDYLLGFDELAKQRLTSRTFGGFCEGKITFAPTFKFDMNSNVYDTSEKNRIPSYCDRILWCGKHCEALLYRSHHDFVMSDHKPVSGYFKIGARRVNRTLFQRAYEAVVRSQDLVYNLSLPQAQLDNQELEFGPVRFYEVCQQSVTLTNTGLSDLQYNFRREGIADFPAWLTISPESMAVEKGASVQINVEIFVKPELVSSLNSGENKLSTIVVLRLNGGKDYFLSISGQFIPTCFGLPLSLLLSLETAPVAWLPVQELQAKIEKVQSESEGNDAGTRSPNEPHPFRIPKELFRLVDFISLHLTEPELFRQSGQYDDVRVIRDMLDTTTWNVSFPDTVSVHSAAFCLLIFLNTLTEAVIPQKFQAHCLESAGSYSAAVKALARVPMDHQNLFYYLTAFLRSCLAMSEKNGTDVQLLASSFGDVVFRDTLASRKVARSFPPPSMRPENTVLFMRHFLTNGPATVFGGPL
ncbi:Type II inositol 1 4 5-trisphosphate 5-phosphatase [Fasciola hepatica]|uniref:Type II inositol 1 4 5-trisphosphate 5-phosphatase n=1 Tax=Fasciola hepatica TaxID=6192 RepID=A0A4E0R366_FASHE|nr:Type II inositol 1 4 5-trisphosphate 5-phosphatase [Fasciola hepatica]